MNILIFGGTTKSPKGAGLCETCRLAHITRGEGVSDERVRCCTMDAAPVEIRRPVCKCSNYVSRGTVSENELEKVAWILKPDGHGHVKFCPPG